MITSVRTCAIRAKCLCGHWWWWRFKFTHQMGSYTKDTEYMYVCFVFFFYLQLQDPECLTSRTRPREQAARCISHSLRYVALSLAHTLSPGLLSGHSFSHTEHRPRPALMSHRHFFPSGQRMSLQDCASEDMNKEDMLKWSVYIKWSHVLLLHHS